MRNRLTRLERRIGRQERPTQAGTHGSVVVDLIDASAGAAPLPAWVRTWLTPEFAQEALTVLGACGAMDA